jgi:phage regulator Rha-like protein
MMASGIGLIHLVSQRQQLPLITKNSTPYLKVEEYVSSRHDNFTRNIDTEYYKAAEKNLQYRTE